MNARNRHRTAPYWVKELPLRELHGLAGKLLNDWQKNDLSEQADWLLERCLDELDYRRRRSMHWSEACHCWLCMPSDGWPAEE